MTNYLPLRALAVGAALSSACSGDGRGDTGTTETAGPTSADPTGDAPTGTPTTGTAGETTATTGPTGDATGDTTGDASGDTSGGVTTGTTGPATDSTTVGVDSETGPDTTGSTGDATTGSTGTTGAEPMTDIEVVITADNAYAFAYGTDDGISMYYGGVEAVTAGQIFNCGEGPETYVIPYAETIGTTQLYIIAWADSAVTQGVLARFRRKGGGGGFGEDVFTGTEGWQACATGVDYQPGSGGPPLAQINEFIGKCNAASLDPNTTSVGWVDEVGTQYGAVAFGEDNTTPYDGGPLPGNEFPLVCPEVMPAEAHWMWFDWDPASAEQSPFLWPGGVNPDHQFLIFRLAAELLPDPQ